MRDIIIKSISKMIYDPTLSLRDKCEEDKYKRNYLYHHINSFNTIKSKSYITPYIDILSRTRYRNKTFQYRRIIQDCILYKVIDGKYVITSCFGRR